MGTQVLHDIGGTELLQPPVRGIRQTAVFAAQGRRSETADRSLL